MSAKGMPPVIFAVDPNHAKRVFIWIFALTLLLKLVLAATFPFTGDEAFFYQWGVYPDWGYYDHPPMVGWMLYGLNQISSHPLVLRFATVLLWSVIALSLLRRYVLALIRPAPRYVQAAVKNGIVTLIVIDAAIALGYADFFWGCAILLLIFPTMLLGRTISMT